MKTLHSVYDPWKEWNNNTKRIQIYPEKISKILRRNSGESEILESRLLSSEKGIIIIMENKILFLFRKKIGILGKK